MLEMADSNFRSASYDCRLHCGERVIEDALRGAVERVGASRAFVVCSRSVNARTDVVERIRSSLGELYAGTFDGIEKDSTYASVSAGTEAAREAGADLLIGIGGGSVLVANRVVAVYLAEPGDPFEIMTQYPEGRPAYSPRLMAPKLPIINIPTTPNSAVNRGGSGLLNPDLDHRMEYFDPKTRPRAVFLDDGALMSTPPDLVRSTATTIFASLVAALSATDVNPLARASRDHAFILARDAYLRLMTELDNPALRQDIALAAFLQNRAEDDGFRRFRGGAFSGNYAVSTALHLRYPNVGQGEATSVVHAPAVRLADEVDLVSARQVAEGLGVWTDGMEAVAAASAVADKLEAIYAQVGVPTRLRQLDIPKDGLAAIASETVKNFNFNPGQRTGEDQVAKSLKLLESAW